MLVSSQKKCGGKACFIRLIALALGVVCAGVVQAAPASVAPQVVVTKPVTATNAVSPPIVRKMSQDTPVRVLLKAPREARIASQINGRIISLPVSMGNSFRRGDLLVGFDCTHQVAEKAAAEAQLNKMTTTLATKKGLAALSALPEVEVDLAAADVAQAKAQLDRAKASVADCRIVAPYNGSVVRVVANHAESVSPGSPLIEIVESGNLHLEALVASSWLTWLKPGHKFVIQVDELGGKEVEAVISAIGARVDPVSQTIPVKARITQMIPGLRPGMSGNAYFQYKP